MSDIAFTTTGTTMIDLLYGGSTIRTAHSNRRAAGSTNLPQVRCAGCETRAHIQLTLPNRGRSQAKGWEKKSQRWRHCGAAMGTQMSGRQSSQTDDPSLPIYSTQRLARTQDQRGTERHLQQHLRTHCHPQTTACVFLNIKHKKLKKIGTNHVAHMYKQGSK